MRFTVRDYRPDDFNTLWAIDQSCFDPEIAYSRYELQLYLRRSGAFALVAESGEENPHSPSDGLRSEPRPLNEQSIVGFIVAENSRRGIGHIITIDVLREARRHHIGSALLASAEEKLRATKSRTVRLETAVDNASALSFYKRHRYDVIKVIPHYYSNGLDALLLEKNLLSIESSS